MPRCCSSLFVASPRQRRCALRLRRGVADVFCGYAAVLLWKYKNSNPLQTAEMRLRRGVDVVFLRLRRGVTIGNLSIFFFFVRKILQKIKKKKNTGKMRVQRSKIIRKRRFENKIGPNCCTEGGSLIYFFFERRLIYPSINFHQFNFRCYGNNIFEI